MAAALGKPVNTNAIGGLHNLGLAEQFAEAGYISLETYRKTGVPVRTTVWLVEDGGVLYIRTSPKSGKAKRIRRNPHVRIAKCDMRGKVKGEWADGEVRQLDEAQAEKARELFKKKYGLQIRLLHAVSRISGGGRTDMLMLGIKLADA